ncbi:MAG: galactokinase [Magnetococcales bacterium]|nr:galactokinase [Magnetococcales bacterium]MBF0156927.1 galactokinase [Magnetococcales bacterium]
MIITRSPLRVSLGGGGTDLPSYYRKHGGFLIAAAIDKYVYTTLHQTFVPELIVKYSRLERVPRAAELKHPIIREALELAGMDGSFLELTSMADIPAGTGLGSSGSFTTGLLKALYTFRKRPVTPERLAEDACHIELDRLKEPIGKQDQYIAAMGGLTCFEFHPDDRVTASPLAISTQSRHSLEENLCLFFTGYSRAASEILKEQDDRSREDDREMLANLHFVKELGYRSREAFESGELREFGRIMDEHWQFKKRRSSRMSNPRIDEWYALAMQNGAVGGKLIGAGGGGFLMFYAEEKMALRRALTEAGMQEVYFRFDFEGTRVVVNG